jgi:hypothetical protein
MARKSLSRTAAEALGPIVVPLITKVALPLAIESMRRGGRFDTEKFFEEARASLAKGVKKSRPEMEDLKEGISDRSSDLYDEVRKQGTDLLESLTERGSALAEDWMSRARPRRRRFRLIHALGLLAVVGVGIAILSRD